VIRVIVSAVFSRGIHNEQIKAQTVTFIAENRPCMVGVFKRFAKIGGSAPADHQATLCELVKSFMALVAATDYLDVCRLYVS
jgi:nuclear pore complex protein Nup205